jgi:hypothetical protein
MEQRFDRVFGRRLAGTHHPIDRDPCRHLIRRVVGAQRLRDVGALIEIVGMNRLDRLDAGILQLLQQFVGDLVVGLGQDLAGGRSTMLVASARPTT